MKNTWNMSGREDKWIGTLGKVGTHGNMSRWSLKKNGGIIDRWTGGQQRRDDDGRVNVGIGRGQEVPHLTEMVCIIEQLFVLNFGIHNF